MTEAAPAGSGLTGSAFGRLLGAFVAPVETFRSIAVRPTWILPFLLLVAVGVGVGTLVMQRMDFEQVIRAQNERAGGQMSAEQVEQAAERAKSMAPILTAVQGVVTPAIYLLVALAFWATFRMVGSDFGYRSSLATTVHATLPSALAAVLSIPVILHHASLTQSEVKNGSFLASSLAVLAPADASPVLRALLGSADLFSLWTVALLVVGFREAARVSRQAALGGVLILWLLYVAGKVALAALLPG
jgi:hypothetical protein